MPRPVHFEIHATDPAVLQAFYADVFGWRFERWGEVPYWVITTGETADTGINGGLLPRPGPAPSGDEAVTGFVVVIEVPDCEEYAQRAVAAGASVALAVTAVPGVGLTAYLRDPDGNLFGIIQPEPMES